MRLVVTLLIRDEIDLAAAWVEYYVAQGVAAIIVTDNASVDGTREVLQEYERLGAITLLHESGDDFRQADWVTRMARLAATDFDADWVLNVDADEFWRSAEAGRTLVEVFDALPNEIGSVLAVRHDLRGPGAESGGWLSRLRWLDRQTVSERGTPLVPKLAHRASPGIEVAMGNHSVEGVSGTQLEAGLIEIVHIPLRSWRQFSGKIQTGGSAVERNVELEPGSSWHWRADLERLRNGTLRAEYDSRSPGRATLRAGKHTGRFVRERRLRRELLALRSRAVAPELLRRSLIA